MRVIWTRALVLGLGLGLAHGCDWYQTSALELEPGTLVLAVNGAARIEAMAITTDGVRRPHRRKVAFTSTRPDVAEVSPTGEVTAKAPGTAMIIATSDSMTATATVRVGDCPDGLVPGLAIGLNNEPADLGWMTASGLPWDYRYQYFTGGVNTGWGWSTWMSPKGEFATHYLEQSASACYVPVLTYYTLVHSDPDRTSEDPDPKLQNPSTMNAYFEDFKLLLSKVGAFGRTAIVHLEPDLWGFLQKRHGDDARRVPVAVATSGFPEAASFEDNAAGFARVLVALRDQYAPRALLGWHASHWATDEPDFPAAADVDPESLGDSLVAFYRSLGAKFDLLFFDPADRDAAFSEIVYLNPRKWWTATEFERFRGFVAWMTTALRLPAVLWQIPIGNRVLKTCDNTWGHFEDNRVEHFLGEQGRQHLASWADAGVVAILFGRGLEGNTTYTDAMKDGITNPSTKRGRLRATLADDDGGYLRLRAREYYLERFAAVAPAP
jgi:hypothetical protein